MKILDKELLKKIILEEKEKLEKDMREGRISVEGPSEPALEEEVLKGEESETNEHLPNTVMEDYDRWTKLSGILLKD